MIFSGIRVFSPHYSCFVEYTLFYNTPIHPSFQIIHINIPGNYCLGEFESKNSYLVSPGNKKQAELEMRRENKLLKFTAF